MAALLLSALFSVFLFYTFGCTVVKTFKIPAGFTDKMLMGLVVSNTIVTILSLFLPVNIDVSIAFLFCCFCLAYFIKDDIVLLVDHAKMNSKAILFFFPFIITAFIIGLGKTNNYDTGLYHLQSIKWIEEYHVIPGLANLHGRLGFNNNLFSLFALSSFQGAFRQEIFSINLVMFSILISRFAVKLYSVYTQSGFTGLFVFYILVIITILQLPNNLSSPSPDFVFETISLFVLVRLIELANEDDTTFNRFIPVLIFSTYLVTVKMAALPLLSLYIFVFIKEGIQFKKVFLPVTFSFLIVIPWLIRNVILTGWLLYPVPSLDLFSFDWKVPLPDVVNEQMAVIGWARNPDLVSFMDAAKMNFSNWFPAWWHHINVLYNMVFICSIAFPLFTLAIQPFKKEKISLMHSAVIIISFTGVLFWLFTAPDFRFGLPFIFVSTLSPLIFVSFNWKPALKMSYVFSTIIIVIYASILFRFHEVIQTNIKEMFFSNRLILPKNIVVPETVKSNAHLIDGVNIYTPFDKTNIGEDRCFDHPIPCTPFITPSLKLRGYSIQAGFRK